MTTPLTAADVAAMRKADSVCFDLFTRGSDVVSQVRAIKDKRVTAADPFAQEVTVTVPVEYRVADYGDHDGEPVRHFTAFYMVHSAQYKDEWQTITGLLRAGDVLSLVWVRDNANGYTRDAGLHLDELRLRVARGDKRALTFNVGHTICRDNTARMIRAER